METVMDFRRFDNQYKTNQNIEIEKKWVTQKIMSFMFKYLK